MDDPKTHPHATSDAVAARLRAGIPGANVAVNAAENTLWISAVFDASDWTAACRKILAALHDKDAGDTWHVKNIQWARNQHDWELNVIRNQVIDALGLRPTFLTDLSHLVRLTTSGSWLQIRVDTAGLFDQLSTSLIEMRRVEDGWRRRIESLAMKLPEGITHLDVRVGTSVFVCTSTLYSAPDDTAFNDFDDDDRNPNWPSRTGNPSGKGRGNNPPRR